MPILATLISKVLTDSLMAHVAVYGLWRLMGRPSGSDLKAETVQAVADALGVSMPKSDDQN